MLVSHEPRRVNLQAASPPATPAEHIIRKPYYSLIKLLEANVKVELASMTVGSAA